ncbi:hypothetical protein C8J57DRAFT_1491817 [Mycena rebaudengoi]|nr:hypothetical protein C8J57DRAFT_1491817 [Mycena rebaudengoi]
MSNPNTNDNPETDANNMVSSEPVENKGQWQKNLTYWYADGSIVIRIEGVLHKIHVSLLTKLSPNMNEILNIPVGREEGTERFPLHLAGITIQEFEDFLLWVYRIEWTPMSDPVERERIFTNLLKVSSVWEIEVGKKYAKTHLEDLYLPPSRRIELARQYSIHEWVKGAVEEIFQKKLADLSDLDIARIGVKAYSILAKGMERMEVEMRRTANVEPPMTNDPDWACTKHTVCITTWKRLWWDKIGRRLLHPDSPIKTAGILEEVKKLAHKDLNEKCRMDMVKDTEHAIVFVDERVVAGVVASIVAYHKTL